MQRRSVLSVGMEQAVRDMLVWRTILGDVAFQAEVQSACEVWHAYTVPMQNEFAERFVERIEIRRKDSEIDVTFKQGIREHFRQ